MQQNSVRIFFGFFFFLVSVAAFRVDLAIAVENERCQQQDQHSLCCIYVHTDLFMQRRIVYYQEQEALVVFALGEL